MRIPRYAMVCAALAAAGLVVAAGVALSAAAVDARRTTVAAAAVTPAPTPEPTPTPPPQEPSVSAPPTITVIAVGDLVFDSAPGRLVKAQGGKAPFTAVAKVLRSADVTVGNLECALSKRGRAVPDKAFTFRGDPRAAQGLVWAGFDLLTLANNHARDYGDTALRDTFDTLDDSGIAWAGAGADRAAAWRPAIIERGGARIAFLGFSEITPGNFAATDERAGTAYTQEIDAVLEAIEAAHADADYVIVSFHWGTELSYTPSARQVREGRAAVRAGADMVLSHHPHVLQGVEFYRQGLIAYSLGNFVFSPGSDKGRQSMILHASLTPEGVKDVSADPVYIGYNGRPTPQAGSRADAILDLIDRTSGDRGTQVRVDGTTAVLTP